MTLMQALEPGGQFDVGTTDLVAGPLELMAFKRRQDIALNAAHS